MMPLTLSKTIHFSSYVVSSQVFHQTRHSFAIVNLKPLLPGHTLVCPIRVVPRISDLSAEEISDLFQAVQRVGNMLTRVYKSDALNIAVQDGEAAGQSVPHVHAHIIPRHRKDLDDRGHDAIHHMLESDEANIGQALHRSQSSFPEDGERKPRSIEEMNKEAAWYAEEMDKTD